jgi:hypothetical protein
MLSTLDVLGVKVKGTWDLQKGFLDGNCVSGPSCLNTRTLLVGLQVDWPLFPAPFWSSVGT